MSENRPAIAIVGPTGAGKSSLAILLAEALGGEVLNFDSVQLYRDLDIGTAKLPSAQWNGVPHHLIDVSEPAQELTAGDYSKLARTVLEQVWKRKAIPILVGGTGLYLRALLEGLSPGPKRDERLRSRLRLSALRRPAVLHRYLKRWDRVTADRIHPNDHQKLIRAIEILRLSGRPASVVQDAPRDCLQDVLICKIGLEPDRALLHKTLNARSAAMFREGLVVETAGLMRAGLPSRAKALQSIGYRQAVEHLEGRMSLEQAIAECQTRTRQYAKRQLTWFHAEVGVTWLFGFGTEACIQEQALRVCRQFLSGTLP